MIITEVKVEMVKNTGNYESERIGFTATLEENEFALDVRDRLKELCFAAFNHSETIPLFVEEKEKKIATSKKPAKKKSPVKAEEEEETIVAAEETKPKKKLKVKLTPYDRTLEIHKKLFQTALNELVPNWKENPAKAKDASISLEGAEFLDLEGSVVDSFKEKLLAEMSK